jgi:hypothetical protein
LLCEPITNVCLGSTTDIDAPIDVRHFSESRHSLSCPHTKRPEFFAARFAKVAKNVDGVLIDHLAQLKKRLVWFQIYIGDLLSDLLLA